VNGTSVSTATLRAGIAAAIALISSYVGPAAGTTVDRARVDELSVGVESQVIAWRRDIHEHPELSNRETRTAKLVAEQLRHLGLQVQTGIARRASRTNCSGPC
jgi:hypothetical protein